MTTFSQIYCQVRQWTNFENQSAELWASSTVACF